MSKLLSLALVFALALTGWCDVHAAPDPGPIPVSAADASWGDADAPVTIVHFSDLQCPFCKRAFDTVEALQTKYGPKKIRVVFKHFPLAFHKQAHDGNAAIDTHQLDVRPIGLERRADCLHRSLEFTTVHVSFLTGL